MAHMKSYNWDHKLGVCNKHLLPEIPCPACLKNASTDPDMYPKLDPLEKHPLFEGEIILSDEFNPIIHEIV